MFCWRGRGIVTLVLLALVGERLDGDHGISDFQSGGATTVFEKGPNAFGMPLANVTRVNRRAHIVGNSFFNKNWVMAPSSTTARDGLGPLFNARSCSSCHVRDGRGSPPLEGQLPTSLLFRLSIPGQDAVGGNRPDPVFGKQLAVRAIPGVEPEGNVSITYESVERRFADGTVYELLKPSYKLRTSSKYGHPHPDLMIGPRIASPVMGLGLLEAVPEEEVVKNSDPDDRDGDDISGKPNYVWNPESKKKELGRFGWKANQPNLRQQTATAFREDIGITSSIRPLESYTKAQADLLKAKPNGGHPEIDELTLGRVVTYLQTLAPPAQRIPRDPKVIRGKELFREIGCSLCHLTTMKTGPQGAIAELRRQTIHPYTDLLLHDMGEELADHRADGEASGSEWRTPPLWGIGLTKIVNGHTRFLHDGRARNLEEAILWHGGEALVSRKAYTSLTKEQRNSMLAFLESL